MGLFLIKYEISRPYTFLFFQIEGGERLQNKALQSEAVTGS